MKNRLEKRVSGLDRIFDCIGEPRPGDKLAAEIMDSRYFRDFYHTCEKICDWLWHTHRIKSHPGTVEGMARNWADAANFAPITEAEGWVFDALDEFAKVFEGWKAVGPVEVRQDD